MLGEPNTHPAVLISQTHSVQTGGGVWLASIDADLHSREQSDVASRGDRPTALLKLNMGLLHFGLGCPASFLMSQI